MSKKYNRREVLKLAGTAAAGATLLGVPAMAAAATGDNDAAIPTGKRRRCLVIGAHPDDPETCCGGTMALLVQQGWDVTAAYLTRGEAGIEGKSHSEAAVIRTAESEAACRVIGCEHRWLGQVDGNTVCDLTQYKMMRDYIGEARPDVVFTHWPLDSHRDHAICGLLVMDAWRRLDYSFALYYMEAMSGMQSMMFTPDTYINIDAVAALKRKACDCHASQGMDDIYRWHERMEKFRGIEARCERAEAFLRHRIAATWEAGSNLF